MRSAIKICTRRRCPSETMCIRHLRSTSRIWSSLSSRSGSGVSLAAASSSGTCGDHREELSETCGRCGAGAELVERMRTETSFWYGVPAPPAICLLHWPLRTVTSGWVLLNAVWPNIWTASCHEGSEPMLWSRIVALSGVCRVEPNNDIAEVDMPYLATHVFPAEHIQKRSLTGSVRPYQKCARSSLRRRQTSSVAA